MRDYAELVNNLRCCNKDDACDGCTYFHDEEKCCGIEKDAADAIEELLAEMVTLRNQLPQQTIETNLYDIEETHPNCTVQILRNSVTGEVSVGWWENEEGADSDD